MEVSESASRRRLLVSQARNARIYSRDNEEIWKIAMSVVQETDGYLVGDDEESGHVGVGVETKVVVGRRQG